MADGTVYCHICKAQAFPKTSFGSVVSLDCGHVARRDGTSFNKTKRKEQRGEETVPPPQERAAFRENNYTRPRKVDIEIPSPPTRPVSPSRTVSGTTNVARSITELMKK